MVEPGAAPLGVAAAAVLGEGHSSGVFLLPLRGGDGEMRLSCAQRRRCRFCAADFALGGQRVRQPSAPPRKPLQTFP